MTTTSGGGEEDDRLDGDGWCGPPVEGNDRLWGGGGNDTLNGGPLEDTCDGETGWDAADATCETILGSE